MASPKSAAFRGPPAEPRPSASVILLSSSNEVLLLHRVQTSSSFPSAHVFPGGNISPAQDGDVAPPGDPGRHDDGPAYRLGAIRECFEESGILLARKKGGGAQEQRGRSSLLEVPEEQRMKGRRGVHANTLGFSQWLDEMGGVPDVDGLMPFTRWITPTNIPRRFTTQMYLYFLPLPDDISSASNTGAPPITTTSSAGNAQTANTTLVPTPDGGVEHTAASFQPASTWLARAQAGEIILFPPQFYLLHLLASLTPLPTHTVPSTSTATLQRQREAVVSMLRSGDPPLGERCISPTSVGMLDGRTVLGLDRPGREAEQANDVDGKAQDKIGISEHVVLVEFGKASAGPRRLEVRDRTDGLEVLRRQNDDRGRNRSGKGNGKL